MPNLLELTAEIVSSHASNNQMSSESLLQEMQDVFKALKALEAGDLPQETTPKQLTVKQAFKKDEVICMVCGKSFITLKKHLATAHNLKPGQYRKQFGIPSSQSLAARSYSAAKRQAATERGLSDVLAKARAERTTKKKKAAGVPMKATKATVTTGKVKAQAPMVKKAPVPAKSARVSKRKVS